MKRGCDESKRSQPRADEVEHDVTFIDELTGEEIPAVRDASGDFVEPVREGSN